MCAYCLFQNLLIYFFKIKYFISFERMLQLQNIYIYMLNMLIILMTDIIFILFIIIIIIKVGVNEKKMRKQF